MTQKFLRYFGALVSVRADSSISYPLCYVKEIFEILNLNPAIHKILEIMNKLESHLGSKHSGLAWECTVEIAIILRMLEAHYFGNRGPFNIVPSATFPALDFRTLPDECNTLEMSRRLMDNMVATYTSPTLIYVGSVNGCYPQVEGFVIYTLGGGGTTKIVGFQMKTGDKKPPVFMDKKIINGGAVLLRGHATAKNPREPKEGWVYKTSMEVRKFIGISLLLAMPRDLLLDP